MPLCPRNKQYCTVWHCFTRTARTCVYSPSGGGGCAQASLPMTSAPPHVLGVLSSVTPGWQLLLPAFGVAQKPHPGFEAQCEQFCSCEVPLAHSSTVFFCPGFGCSTSPCVAPQAASTSAHSA